MVVIVVVVIVVVIIVVVVIVVVIIVVVVIVVVVVVVVVVVLVVVVVTIIVVLPLISTHFMFVFFHRSTSWLMYTQTIPSRFGTTSRLLSMMMTTWARIVALRCCKHYYL